MNPLEKAQAIINSLEGVTDSNTVKNAMDSLAEYLIEMKEICNYAHKQVNAAKDAEDDAKLFYKKIEAMLAKATRQRQELRDEKYALRV